MKTLILSIALIAFMFVSCDNSQAPTQPQTSSSASLKATQIKDLPFTVTLPNECCGELVSLTGTVHMVIRDNGLHINGTDITGTGLSSGETYTGHNTAIHNEHDNSGNGAEVKARVIHVSMTNENGCSFTLMIHVHITFNANGEATAVIDSIETKCD
jgi:hypothetical protein